MDNELVERLDPSLYNVDSRADLHELEIVLTKIGQFLTEDYGNQIKKSHANAIAEFIDSNAFWETAWVAIPALREPFDPKNTLNRPRALQYILEAVNGRMSNNVLVEGLPSAEKDLIIRLTDTIAYLKSLTGPQDIHESSSDVLNKLAIELSNRAQQWRKLREDRRASAFQLELIEIGKAEESPRVQWPTEYDMSKENGALLKTTKTGSDPFQSVDLQAIKSHGALLKGIKLDSEFPKTNKKQVRGLAGSQWAPGAPGFFEESGPREWENADYYQSTEPTPVKWVRKPGSAGHYVVERVTNPEERRIIKLEKAFDKLIGSDGSKKMENSPVSSGDRVPTPTTPSADPDSPLYQPRPAINTVKRFLEQTFTELPQLEETMRNVWQKEPGKKQAFVREMLELVRNDSDVQLADFNAPPEPTATASPDRPKLNAETLSRLGSIKRGGSSGDEIIEELWEETSPKAIAAYYFEHKSSMKKLELDESPYFQSLLQPTQEELERFIENEFRSFPTLRNAAHDKLKTNYKSKEQLVHAFWKVRVQRIMREMKTGPSTQRPGSRPVSPRYESEASPEALNYDADTEPTPQVHEKIASKVGKSRKTETLGLKYNRPLHNTSDSSSASVTITKTQHSPTKDDPLKTPAKKQQPLAEKPPNQAIRHTGLNVTRPRPKSQSTDPEPATTEVPAHLLKFFVPEDGGPPSDSPDAYQYDPRRGVKW